MKLAISLLLVLMTVSVIARAQAPEPQQSASIVPAAMQAPTDPFEAQFIPRNSRVYIAQIGRASCRERVSPRV